MILMPAEIFWEICPGGNDHYFDFGTIQRVRFRRPQLIRPADIILAFRDLLDFWNRPRENDLASEMIGALFSQDMQKIQQGIEQGTVRVAFKDTRFGFMIACEKTWPRTIIIDAKNMSVQEEKEPSYLLPDEEVLSIKKTYCYPLKMVPVKENIGDSLLCISHNVPLAERPIMGACAWYTYTQPLTSLELKINDGWWDAKRDRGDRKEGREIWATANNLFWFFQRCVNEGILVRKLVEKGYDLMPRFDQDWATGVLEDQCEECGKIHATLPHKLSEVKIGKISKNYCHCRWKRDRRYNSAIERKFRVVGIYPISPDEAEHASYEAMLQADSAD
jgi:hypothetical protein